MRDMSHPTRLVRLGRIGAAEELAAVGEVMRQVAGARASGDARGALILAELVGDGCALGRYQAGDYAVGPHGQQGWVRRWTGGHTTAYGDGIVSVHAVLPDPSCWLDEPGPLPGDRLINRYARGVVRGLVQLGLQAAYTGRDFVTAERKRAGYVSAERDARGVTVFQSVLGVVTFYDMEAEPVAAPGLPPPPPPTRLVDEIDADDSDALGSDVLEALAEGFAGQFRLEFEEAKLEKIDPAGALSLERPEGAGLVRGEESAVPIGIVEAFAALDASGAIERVCLAGEWIADSAGVAALEQALVGVRPDPKALAPVVQRFLSDPQHFFIGVPSADPVVRAIASAARAAEKKKG
jgi:hypothetical protein